MQTVQTTSLDYAEGKTIQHPYYLSLPYRVVCYTLDVAEDILLDVSTTAHPALIASEIQGNQDRSRMRIGIRAVSDNTHSQVEDL